MDRAPIWTLLLVGSALSAGSHALNDPTQPTDPLAYFGAATSRDDSSWSLQSILSSRQRRFAVTNGTRGREGDRPIEDYVRQRIQALRETDFQH